MVVVNVRFFIKSIFIIQICPFYHTHTHTYTHTHTHTKNKQTNKQNKTKFIVPEPEPICAYFFLFWKAYVGSRFPNFSKKKKKSSIKIINSMKKFKTSKFFKKKKKKSSLNSSSWTESYDPLPYFTVVQHQVNCPPSAFFEAWSMSQTRGIRQVCQILFNE